MPRPAIAMASLLGALGACSCSSAEPVPGQIVVVVTTDLAVPVDIDSLFWRVSIAASDDTVDDGPFPLASGSELPATIAIIAGSEANRDVRVQLWGYKGREQRVHREAELRVPERGVRVIALPLEWLCSDANPNASCADGASTCRAGECVERTTIDNLQVLPPSIPCFDVLGCFEGMSLRDVPAPGQAGTCRIAAPSTTQDPNLNVALVVNTAMLGNYGACQPLGSCLVPLDRDTPGGWRFEDGSIVLPPAVCGSMRERVLAIALGERCPTKPRFAPSCRAFDTCASFDGPWCAEPLPLGYSCTGSVTPFGLNPDPATCSKTEPDAPVAGALYCCGDG